MFYLYSLSLNMANFHQAPSFYVFSELKGGRLMKERKEEEKKIGKESKISNVLQAKILFLPFYIKSNISNNLISFIHPLLDHV